MKLPAIPLKAGPGIKIDFSFSPHANPLLKERGLRFYPAAQIKRDLHGP